MINKFFDYKYYIYKYNDLTRFNQQEAINHFLTYGMNEKRLFNRNLESIKQIINKIPHDKFLVVCIDYLKNSLLSDSLETFDNVSIIGSSFTAMDCARTALRNYSKEVNVYARNDFKNNLHLTKELEALLKEGGNTHNHHSLLKVEKNL